jgi:hypothetical protein
MTHKKYRLHWFMLVLVTLFAGLAVHAFAQGGTNTIPVAVWPNLPQIGGLQLHLIMPVLIPLIIAAVRAKLSTLPPAAVAWLAPILGIVSNRLLKLGLDDSTAGVLGMAGIGARELQDQTHGAFTDFLANLKKAGPTVPPAAPVAAGSTAKTGAIRLSLMLGLATLAFVVVALILPTIGCVHTPVVTNGATNIVTTIDPVKLQKVERVVELNAASVVRRVINNSPQHSKEIADYARAVGSVFCQASANGQVSPEAIILAADQATQGLQAGVDPLIIDGKNGIESLYVLFFDDSLTVQLPDNKWPKAVCDTICNTIDKALKDAGQPGVK